MSRFAMSAGIAGALLLTALDSSLAQAAPIASQVTYPTASRQYYVYASNNSVEAQGKVVFNSNGSATVTGVGIDNAADGEGPYLEEIYSDGGTIRDDYTASCAAGAGHSCNLPSHTGNGPAYNPITIVELQICAGKYGVGNDYCSPVSYYYRTHA